MRMRLIISFLLFVNSFTTYSVSKSERMESDSSSEDSMILSPVIIPYSSLSFADKLDKTTSSRWYKMFYITAPLAVTGVIITEQDKQFNSMREEYMPKFSQCYDDYTQYAPAALMLALKSCGYESKYSWGRMLTADAFSVAIMAGTVNLLKYTVKRERPDGSANNSFPSGHTATAFMTATMLHKEYGDRSPWFSIGAYTLATVTGFTRQFNNKHWMGDVMVGASIGVLSTELGYLISELLFKDKGINRRSNNLEFDFKDNYCPSYVGTYVGFSFIPGSYSLNEGGRITFSHGAVCGLGGAYYLNPRFGVGGRLTFTGVPYAVDGVAQDKIIATRSALLTLNTSYPIPSR